VFEGLTSAWFLGNLIPPLGRVAPLYTLFGKVISAVDLVVGLSGVALMTFLNASGARLAVGFQKLVTFSFLGASALLAGLGLMRGNVSHWQPLFTPRIMAICWCWG
jgi:amino acid transporter